MNNNSITDYMQRIGKGIAYSAIGVLKEQTPVTSKFFEQNTDVVKNTVANATNIKQISEKVSNLTDEYIFRPANKLLQNLREDIKTGEFFHPERQEESDLEMMKALLGDDMADMLNGDFDESEFEDESNTPAIKGIPTVTRGESIIASTVQQSSINSADYIVSANRNLTKAQIEANKAISSMQYSMQERQIATLENGFFALSKGLNSIIEFNNQALLVHIENSKQFYDQMTTFTQENNAILKELIEIQRGIYKSSTPNEEEENKKPSAKDIFANGLNLKEYFKYVEGNIDNSPIGMALQFARLIPAMVTDAVQNPLEFVSKQIIDAMMGPKLKTALQKFDTTFSGFFQTALAKLADAGRDKKNGDSIFGMIARLFGYKEQNTKFGIHGDPSKYNKGNIPYNGIANKSIVEVIPGYLARIEAALTGQGERHFNYQSGKWASLKETKRIEKTIDHRLENDALRTMRQNLNEYLSMINFDDKNKDILKNDKQRREFRQLLNRVTKGIYEKGYISPDDILSDELNRYGKREIKPEYYNLIYTLIKNLPTEVQLGVTSTINQSKATKREIMNNMQTQNQGLYNILLNDGLKGAIEAKSGIQQYSDGTTVNRNLPSDLSELKDKRGLTLFDYQLRIYRELFLLRSTGMGSYSRSKRMKNMLPGIFQKLFGTDKDVSLTDLQEILSNDESGMKNSIDSKGNEASSSKQNKLNSKSSNKSEFLRSDEEIEEYDKEQAKKKYNTKKNEVREIFRQLNELGVKDQFNENYVYSGSEIANLKTLLNTLIYNKQNGITQVNLNNRRFGTEDTYTRETSHSIERELNKIKTNRQKALEYSNTSMLGSALGIDGSEVEWPQGVDPNAPFLDQMMQAADIGSKMKVITNNISNLASAPTALLTSAINSADQFLYDALYKRKGPIYDDKGKPVEGLFNIMVWEMKQSMTKLNNWMDDAFDQFKSKLDGGMFGKFKSFAKDYLDIDIDSGIDSFKGLIKKGTAPFVAGALGVASGAGNSILDSVNGTLRDLGLDIQIGRNGLKSLPNVTVKQTPTKENPFIYDEENDEVTRTVYDTNGNIIAKHIIKRDEKGNIVEYLDTGKKDKDGNKELKKLYEGKEAEDAFNQTKKNYKQEKRKLQDRAIVEEGIREGLVTPTKDNLTTYNKETGVLEVYRQNSEGQIEKVSSMYKDDDGNVIENYYNNKTQKWESRKLQGENTKKYSGKVEEFENKVSNLTDQAILRREKELKDKENAAKSKEAQKQQNKEKQEKVSNYMSAKEKRQAERLLEKISKGKIDKLSKSEKALVAKYISLYKPNLKDQYKDSELKGYFKEENKPKEEKQEKNSIEKEQEKQENITKQFKPTKNMPFTINDDGSITYHSFDDKGSVKNKRKFRKTESGDIEEETDIGWGRIAEDKYNAKDIFDNIDDYKAKITESVKKEKMENPETDQNSDKNIFDSMFESIKNMFSGKSSPLNETDSNAYKEFIGELVTPSLEEVAKGLGPIEVPKEIKKGSNLNKWAEKLRQKGYSNETILRVLRKQDPRFIFKDGKFSKEDPNEKNKRKKVEKAGENAKGIKQVEKGGLTFISPGEAIIPANLNPFNPDRDKVNIKDQLHKEKNMKSRMLDKINNAQFRAEGTPKIFDVLESEASEKVNQIFSKFSSIFGADKIDFRGLKAEELLPLLTLFMSDTVDRGKNWKEQIQPFLDLFGITDENIIGYTDKKVRKAVKSIGDKAPDLKLYADPIIQALIRSDFFQNLDEDKKSFIRERIKNYGYDKYLPTDKDVRTEKVFSQEGPIGFVNQISNRAFGLDVGKASDLTLEYITKNLGSAMGGAGIGALLSAVFPLGGPLFGAVAGSAAALLANNKTLNEFVFGKEIVDPDTGRKSRENGMLPSYVVDLIEKYSPDLKKYGIAGSIAGLLTPLGPLGGLMVGAGLSVLKNNQSAQEFLFGDNDGILNKDRKQFLKKAFPNIAAGALSMLLLGPFGVLGNAALGSGLGLLSTSESFKDIVLGSKDRYGVRRGGLADAIRIEITEPFKRTMDDMRENLGSWFRKKIFEPTGRAMSSTTKLIAHTIKISLNRLTTSIVDQLKETKIGKLFGYGLKGIRKLGNFGKNVVKYPFKLIGSAVSGVGNGIADVADALMLGQGLSDEDAAQQIKFAKEHSFLTNILPGGTTVEAVNKYVSGKTEAELAALNSAMQLYLDLKNEKGSVNRVSAENLVNAQKEFKSEIFRVLEQSGITADQMSYNDRTKLGVKLAKLARKATGKIEINKELSKAKYQSLPVEVRDQLMKLAEEYSGDIYSKAKLRDVYKHSSGVNDITSILTKEFGIQDSDLEENKNAVARAILNQYNYIKNKKEKDEVEGSGETELEQKMKEQENESASLELELESVNVLKDIASKLETMKEYFTTGQLQAIPNINAGFFRDLLQNRAFQQRIEIGDQMYDTMSGKIISKKEEDAKEIIKGLEDTGSIAGLSVGTVRELTENRSVDNLNKLGIIYSVADNAEKHGAYIDSTDDLVKLPIKTIEKVAILTGYGYSIPASQYETIGKIDDKVFDTIVELAKLGVRFGSFEKFIRLQESENADVTRAWLLELAKVKLHDGKTVKDYMTADTMIDNLLSKDGTFMNKFVLGYTSIQQGFDNETAKGKNIGYDPVQDLLATLSDSDLDENQTIHQNSDYKGYNGKKITNGARIAAMASRGVDLGKRLASEAMFGKVSAAFDGLNESIANVLKYSFPNWFIGERYEDLIDFIKAGKWVDKKHRKEIFNQYTDDMMIEFLTTNPLLSKFAVDKIDKLAKSQGIGRIKKLGVKILEKFTSDIDGLMNRISGQDLRDEIERRVQEERERIENNNNRTSNNSVEEAQQRQEERNIRNEEIAQTVDIRYNAEGTTGVVDDNSPKSVTDAFVKGVANKIDPGDNKKANNSIEEAQKEQEQSKNNENNTGYTEKEIASSLNGIYKSITEKKNGDREVSTDYGILLYTPVGSESNRRYILAQTKENQEIMSKIKERDGATKDSIALLNRIANSIENKDFGKVKEAGKKALSGGIFGILKDMLNFIPNMLDMIIPGLGSTVLKGGLGLLASGLKNVIGYGFDKFLNTGIGNKVKGIAGKINNTAIGGAIFRKLGLDKTFGLNNNEENTLAEQQLEEQKKTNSVLENIERNTREGSSSSSTSDDDISVTVPDFDSDKKTDDKDSDKNKSDDKKNSSNSKGNNKRGKWYDRFLNKNKGRIKTGAKIGTGLALAAATAYGVHHFASQSGKNGEGLVEAGARNLYNDNIVDQNNSILNLAMKDHKFNPEPYRSQFEQVGGMLTAYEWNMADQMKADGISDDNIATTIINRRKNNNNTPYAGNSVTNDAQQFATDTYNGISGQDVWDVGSSFLMSNIASSIFNAAGAHGTFKNALLTGLFGTGYDTLTALREGKDVGLGDIASSLMMTLPLGLASTYTSKKFWQVLWNRGEKDKDKENRLERERSANKAKGLIDEKTGKGLTDSEVLANKSRVYRGIKNVGQTIGKGLGKINGKLGIAKYPLYALGAYGAYSGIDGLGEENNQNIQNTTIPTQTDTQNNAKPIIENPYLSLAASFGLPMLGSQLGEKYLGGGLGNVIGGTAASFVSKYLTTGELDTSDLLYSGLQGIIGYGADKGIGKIKKKIFGIDDEEDTTDIDKEDNKNNKKEESNGTYDSSSDEEKKAIDRYRQANPEDSKEIDKNIKDFNDKNKLNNDTRDEKPDSPPNKTKNNELNDADKKSNSSANINNKTNTGSKLTGKTKEIFMNLLGKLKGGLNSILEKCSSYIPGKKSKAAVQNFFKAVLEKCKLPKSVGRVVKYAARFLGLASPAAILVAAVSAGIALYSFIDGYNSADKILGLPSGSATMGMKVVAGLINAAIGATPISIFLDTEEVVQLAIEYVGPVFGFTKQDLDRMAREGEQQAKENNQPTTLSQDVGKVLSDTYESAKDLVLNGPSRVKNYIQDKWNNFTDWVSNTAGNIKDTVVNTWNNTTQWASNTANDAKNWVADKWNSAGNAISNEAQYLKNVFMPSQEELNKRMGKGKHSTYGTGAFYSQLDPQFNMSFNAKGDTVHQTMFDSGCGPMAAANALSSLGIQDNPMVGAKFALSKYKEKNGGTKPEFFTDYMKKKGVESERLYSHKDITDSLKSGNPVILMGKDSTGETSRTPYAENPHYITATGIDKKGNIIIQDPESRTPNKIYRASEVLNKSNIAISTGKGKHKKYNSYGKGLVSKAVKYLYGRGNSNVPEQVWDFLMSKGIGSQATAAIMGNMEAESSYDPTSVNEIGATGLCQWYDARATALKNYAASKGTDWSDVQTQLEYLWIECTGAYSGVLQDTINAPSLEDAVVTWEKGFEVSGDTSSYPRRKASAKEAFDKQGKGIQVGASYKGGSSGNSGAKKDGGLFGALSAITNIFAEAINPFKAFKPSTPTNNSNTTTKPNDAGWNSILDADMAEKRMTPEQKVENMVQQAKNMGKQNVSNDQIAYDALKNGTSTSLDQYTDSTKAATSTGLGKKYGRGGAFSAVGSAIGEMAKDAAVDAAANMVVNAVTDNEDQTQAENQTTETTNSTNSTDNKTNNSNTKTTTSSSSGGMFGFLESQAQKMANPLKESMSKVGKAIFGAISAGPMAQAIKVFFGDNNPFLSMFGGDSSSSGNNSGNKNGLQNQSIKVAGNPIDTLLGAIPGTVVTSTYMTEDGRPTPGAHGGIDIGGDENSPIPSPISGEVVDLGSGYGSGYGHYIQIRDSNGNYHLIGHCNDQYVSVGQQIKPGDIIGTLGNTGASTGPHIHYEIDPPENMAAVKSGPHLDPYTYGGGKHAVSSLYGKGKFDNIFENSSVLSKDVMENIDSLEDVESPENINIEYDKNMNIPNKYGTGNVFSNLFKGIKKWFNKYIEIKDAQEKPIKDHNEKVKQQEENKENTDVSNNNKEANVVSNTTNTSQINSDKIDKLILEQSKTNELIASNNALLSKLVELTIEIVKSGSNKNSTEKNVNTKQNADINSLTLQLSKIGNGSRFGIGDKFVASKQGEVESIVNTMQAIASR